MAKAVFLADKMNKPEKNWGSWSLLFTAVFFFMVNLFASIALFPAYSLYIGSTPFQAGLQSTAFAVAAVLLRIIFGPMIDRYGPKPLMLLGAFTFATAPLLLIASQSYSVLLAARVYQAMGLAVVLPGISALTAEMAPEGRIGTYLGSVRIFMNLAVLAGPAGAFFIIESFGYRQWFFASILIGSISMILLLGVSSSGKKQNYHLTGGSLKQFVRALENVRVYPLIGAIALFSFTYGAILSFAAVHIEKTAPSAEAPLFFVFLGFSGIVASLAAGALSDRFGRRTVAWPLLALLGVGSALFYLIPQWNILILVCAVLFGVGIQGSSLVFAAWLIDTASTDLRATTISLQENTIDICFALSALSFGLAAQGPGLGFAFLLAGTITVLLVFPLRSQSDRFSGQSKDF